MLARALAAAVVLTAARAYGSGFALVEQSPEAAATAGAQAADAYAAAAVYYNPAAMAFQRGFVLQAGADVIVPRATATTAAGEAASSTVFATPTVFVAQRLGARFAFGVGVFDPFAASTAYPADWAGRFVGTSLDIRAVAVNPSVAIRPLPWLGFGFGVDIVPTTFASRRAVMGSAGAAETELRISASATGIGGNAAMLVRIVPRWLDAAVTYRSAIDVDLSSSAVKGTLPLPHSLTFALASRPLTGLTVTADVGLTLWQDLTTIGFTFSDMTTPRETLTLNWQNTVGVRAGATYQFLRDADGEPRLAVRIGGGWEQAPTSPAATSPLFADGDRILAGAGLGARLGPVSIDAGYLAAIVGEYTGASGTFFARYRATTHTVAFALTFRLPSFPARLDEPEYKR